MADFVKEQGINYPVAADIDKQTVTAFKVDSFPDYYVIDRTGKLRFADLANAELERAITTLLAEGGQAAPSNPWTDALADAQKRRKRVLVTTVDKAAQAELGAMMRKDRDLSQTLSFEYVRYDLHRSDEPMPTGHPAGLEAAGAALMVFDHKGVEVARAAWSDLRGEGGLVAEKTRAFLVKNAGAHPQAEEHFAAALARAKAENKRLLVHLGAPW